MIRLLLKYSLSALAILFFVLAGTGYNIIKHCCIGCAQQHTIFTSDLSCNHNNDVMPDACCGTLPLSDSQASVHVQLLNYSKYDDLLAPTCGEDNHCSIIRVELDYFAYTHPVNTETIVKDLVAHDLSFLHNSFSFQLNSNEFFSRPPPPILIPQSGRTLLSKKSVLLI